MITSVRTLKDSDLSRLIAMDQTITGRKRDKWYQEALSRAQGGAISLCFGVEVEGILVGAILGSVRYGEFGRPEPVAEVDTIIVDPAFKNKDVGHTLMETLVKHLKVLHVTRLQTQVDWQQQNLIGFLGNFGFTPTPTLVLEYRI